MDYKKLFEDLYTILGYVIVKYGNNNLITLPIQDLESLNGKRYTISSMNDVLNNAIILKLDIQENENNKNG